MFNPESRVPNGMLRDEKNCLGVLLKVRKFHKEIMLS